MYFDLTNRRSVFKLCIEQSNLFMFHTQDCSIGSTYLSKVTKNNNIIKVTIVVIMMRSRVGSALWYTSGCGKWKHPLPAFSTCGGLLLAMTRLFCFTLFMSGFANRLPALLRSSNCGFLSNCFIMKHVVIPLRFLKLHRSALHFAFAKFCKSNV